MRPRLVTFILIALVVLIQYPLWWGRGGWLRVHDLQQQLDAQQKKNSDLKLRNDRLSGEVDDLRDGTAAIEERARFELGMVKSDEVFVQFVSPETQPPNPLPSAVVSTRGQMSSTALSVVPDPPIRQLHKPSRGGAGSKPVARHP